MDLHVEVGASVTVELYVDGVLASSATAANAGGRGVARQARNQGHDTSTIAYAYVLEIIVADEDTQGMRYAELRPNAAGAYAERRFVTNDIKMGEAPPLSDLEAWRPYLPDWTETFIYPGHHDYSIGGATKQYPHNFTLVDLSQSHDPPY